MKNQQVKLLLYFTKRKTFDQMISNNACPSLQGFKKLLVHSIFMMPYMISIILESKIVVLEWMEKLALIVEDGNLFNDSLPRMIPALKAVGLFRGKTLYGKKTQEIF